MHSYLDSGEFTVNSVTASNQQFSSNASLASGGFVVVWSDESHLGGDSDQAAIKAQIFDASGAHVGTEFLINSSTIGYQENPVVVGLASGGFVVVWEEFVGSGLEARARIFSSTGTPLGGDFPVGTSSFDEQSPAVTALPSGEFVVTWVAQENPNDAAVDINVQRFGATGSRLGDQVTVNTDKFTAGAPAIAALDGGSFVVTWEEWNRDGIKAQLFASNGTKVGEEFVVNSADANSHTDPRVTSLSSGGFVITWLEGGERGSELRAHIFDAAGTPIGSELLIDSVQFDFDYKYSLAGLPDGGFIVTWHHLAGSQDDVQSRIFSASGSPVESEFTVNDTLSGGQHWSAVNVLDSGAIVVTWTDESAQADGSGSAIKAKIYSAGPFGGTPGNDNYTGTNADDVMIGGAGGDTLSGLGGNDQIYSDAIDPNYPGSSGISYDVSGDHDILNGGSGDDDLFAGYGDDVDGGTNDGEGDDLYISFRGAPAGVTADFRLLATQSSITVAGGTISNVENVLYLEGSDFDDFLAPIVQMGFSGPNPVYGRGGDDQIIASARTGSVYGGDGDDFIDLRGTEWGNGSAGEAGNDHIIGGSEYHGEVLSGGSGSDTVEGRGGGDSLDGGEGDDIIDGGSSTDMIYGGSGDDKLYGAGDSDEVNGGDGADTIYGDFSLISSANELFIPDNGDRLNGDAGDDTIYGNNGNDLINGGAGADAMFGGTENDTYVVDNAGDVVTELTGEGTDTVQTTLGSGAGIPARVANEYILPDNVENLTGTLNTGQGLRGNDLNNVITAGGGADFIDLVDGGSDTVNSGDGRDVIYYGGAMDSGDANNGGDEGGDARGDLLVLQGDYSGGLTLGDGALVDVEKLRLLKGVSDSFGYVGGGTFSYDITSVDANVAAGARVVIQGGSLQLGEHLTFNGSAESDGSFQVFGGHDSDTLIGGAQGDHLLGRNGDDHLVGNGGNDRFRGGLGADLMEGGAGSDTFVYAAQAGPEGYPSAVLESTGTGYDTILGFAFGSDKIDLPQTVSSLASASTGALNDASFNSDLAAAVDGSLAANGAVLFTASAGDHSGDLFLVVDADGNGSYQANLDYVIHMDAATGPVPITPDFFV